VSGLGLGVVVAAEAVLGVVGGGSGISEIGSREDGP
ncbi:hypothetical protein A2U01_0094747, partial [Trifolium medium]|nr:hypothetical protein [Trifolium medium]